MSKYKESCRTKRIQESFVMLVTYRYKFVALKKFVAFKYNSVAIIFCHNQKSNRIQKVIFWGTNQKHFFLNSISKSLKYYVRTENFKSLWWVVGLS